MKTRTRARTFGAAAAATAVVLAATGLSVAAASSADAAGQSPGLDRDAIALDVSLTEGTPADQELHAVIYEPKRGRVQGMQVMIPGATYNHNYWDLETEDGRVSQAREAARDGWITVAVDRLGTGESTRPAAEDLDNTVHAWTIQQLITELEGEYGDLPVALVGHSLGTAVAIQTAATYDSVDAVVATGMIHYTPPAGGTDSFGAMLIETDEEPTFAGGPVPDGYLTTRESTRHRFYWGFNADQSTFEADDAAKDTVVMNEVEGFLAEVTTDRYSKDVTVPVLSVLGEHDGNLTAAQLAEVVADEPNSYPASPDMEVLVVEDTGHNLALHRNYEDTTEDIDDWLSDVL